MPEETPPKPPSKEKNGSVLNLPGRIWSTVHRSIFDAPKGLWDAVWRICSISMVTGFLTSAFMVWRYPEVVYTIITNSGIESQIMLDIFERTPHIKEKTMNLLGSYVAMFNPSHIALVNWETQTGIHEVWASSSTQHWPTATSGVMSINMRDPAGYMIFDMCWVGDMENPNYYDTGIVAEEGWLVCGLSNDHDLWGYVIVHFDGEEVPPQAAEGLRILTTRLEGVIFR